MQLITQTGKENKKQHNQLNHKLQSRQLSKRIQIMKVGVEKDLSLE